LDQAERRHTEKIAAIRREIEALEKRSQTEESKWAKEKERLTTALKRARG
jgi:hypothetical protein